MKQCPKCQELNLDEAVVCSKCGAALNETQPPEQQAAGEAAASAENEVNSADNAAAPQRDIVGCDLRHFSSRISVFFTVPHWLQPRKRTKRSQSGDCPSHHSLFRPRS